MGILNITPDSFSDGGQFLSSERATEHGLQLLDEGADILDLGAESTRPGSRAGDPRSASVSAEQEQARLLPVLEAIRKARPDAVISVDTYKSATARAAIAAGAEIINDVSGFTWDAEMAATCANLRCGVVLMHTHGRPDEWLTQVPLQSDSVLPLVREGLAERLALASRSGISPDFLVLDPGYGFGKRFDENYALLAQQSELMALGRPLLCGVSRKSFLTRTMLSARGQKTRVGHEAIERASLAALVATILLGASVVRVHSVQAAVEAASIADAVLAARP